MFIIILVWSFAILYWTGSNAHEFSVRTNLKWNLFQRLAQIYLGVTAEDRIGYRVIRGGTSEALCCLRGASDWEYALRGIRTAATQDRYEAMEIHNASALTLYP